MVAEELLSVLQCVINYVIKTDVKTGIRVTVIAINVKLCCCAVFGKMVLFLFWRCLFVCCVFMLLLFFVLVTLIFGDTFLNNRITLGELENMHIPDGYLSLSFAIPAFLITLFFWIISFKKIKLTEQQVPMMGLLTALFFAAMFVNIPVFGGGTTVHLLGGAAIGLILGPFAGLISMSIILFLQAFLYQDGGLVVLGANVLNIGIIGVFIPCIIFIVLNKLFKPKTDGLIATIFISAFFSDLLAAISAGVQIGLSSTPLSIYGLRVILPTVAAYHSVIGIIEGFVTVILIMTLLKLRPDVLEKSPILGKLIIFQDKAKREETHDASE